MTANTHLDRRDLLKATGVAAGAAALGATDRVLASTSHSHIIAASDSHLGAPKANESDFLDFINNDVPAKDPDALILNGDVLEFWTRGMSSACLDFNDFTNHLEDLDANGIDVVLTAGNHDRRLIDVGRSDYDAATLEAPWSIAEEFHFSSGGKEFVAVHGDGGDPLQNPTTSELLCLGSDDFGKVVWDFYQAKDDIGSADSKFIGETDTIDIYKDPGNWHDINFQQNYKDPVVIAAPLTRDGSDPAHARVRKVDKDDFQIQIEEWEYEDNDHIGETVGYVALSTGVHTLPDGTEVEVGRVKTDESWASVSFSNDFDGTPAVLAGTQTHNCGCLSGNSDSVVARTRNVDPDGFEARVQEQESGGNHDQEQIGYIAIEQGTGKNNGEPFEAGRTADTVTDDWTSIGYGQSFGSAPNLIASVSTFDGPDPVGLRRRNNDASGIEVFLEEETSSDDETGHYSEVVDYFAVEDSARIYASHSTSFSDWWDVVADNAWDVWNDVTSNVSVPTNDIVLDDPPMMAGLESKGSAGPGTVAKNLLDEFPNKYVVFGHTHVPAKGDRYVNSGAWTSRGGATLSGGSHPENTYVEIKDGDATVYDWTSSGSTVYLD